MCMVKFIYFVKFTFTLAFCYSTRPLNILYSLSITDASTAVLYITW